MAQPTLLSIETLRFTKAPFATDVFALGVHFRGAPRSDAITVKHRACVVLGAQLLVPRYVNGKVHFLPGSRPESVLHLSSGIMGQREKIKGVHAGFCALGK